MDSSALLRLSLSFFDAVLLLTAEIATILATRAILIRVYPCLSVVELNGV